jgi:hypothetical protein
MPDDMNVPLKGFEDAEAALKRVEPDALALSEDQFAAMNLDVVGATSIILGVLDRVLPFRDRMAKLPEFDIRNVDCLEDRAKAAWYAFIVNLPEPEPKDFQQMFEECKVLRATLLTWAEPLVFAGQFERTSIDKIKEGSGNKDIPSDVVALVALFRSKWDTIKNMCGVTEEQLDRGATIAPIVFATVSRRENKVSSGQTEGSQRVRRFWTLADRSYDQCQRAIQYLQWDEDNAKVILPSLRRNQSTRGIPREETPTDTPATPVTPAPPAPPAGPVVGGGSDPFVRN